MGWGRVRFEPEHCEPRASLDTAPHGRDGLVGQAEDKESTSADAQRATGVETVQREGTMMTC